MEYKINEIFYSIQGEGMYTGFPAIFIRFSGCNLKCAFCDTQHQDFKILSINQILEKIREVSAINTYRVILTGGEPTLQDYTPLIKELYNRYFRIHIESNGADYIKGEEFLQWITISPKNQDFVQREGNELKLVYNGQSKQIINSYLDNTNFEYYFLQPQDNNPKFIKEAIEICKENNRWKLSVQLHKILKIQ